MGMNKVGLKFILNSNYDTKNKREQDIKGTEWNL